VEPFLHRIVKRLGARQQKRVAHRPFIATAETPVKRAVEWLHANENPRGGIFLSSGDVLSYPEVTGYLIPTLLNYREQELAIRFARWLIAIQRNDGSFTSADGFPHVFDTGQALRGVLAASNLVPEAVDAAARSVKYLRGRMPNDGARGFRVDSVWMRRYSRSIPLSSHMYVLPPLIAAAGMFHDTGLKSAVENGLEHYLKSQDALNLGTLTHFLAYELEALIDLGEIERALPVLNRIREMQEVDGSVRGWPGVSWVCTPGLAQLAVCWYKVGQREPADKALKWLESHQSRSGGFLGSYGDGASYFPDVEIPWAAKFYLDAALLRDGIKEMPASQ